MQILVVAHTTLIAEAIARTLRTRGYDASIEPCAPTKRIRAARHSVHLIRIEINLIPKQLGPEARLTTHGGALLPLPISTSIDPGSIRLWGHATGLAAVEAMDSLCSTIDAILERARYSAAFGLPKPTTSPRLSPRKTELLRLIAEGYRTKGIASKLGLQPSTVDEHIGWLQRRLGARNRAHLVKEGIRHGLIHFGDNSASLKTTQ